MAPLVSILIPAYNAERWITDTINSALNQTWQRKEIIVVDDGSRDQTLAITRRFASSKVSIVTQENQGASAARNRAFALSQGDYIQWLDADDLLSRDKIEKQVRAAVEANNRRLLFSCRWGYFMYRPAKARFVPSPLWCDLPPLEWLLRKWEHNAHMQTATWLVSRELSQEAGPFDTRLAVDNDGEYFFRAISRSEGIRFVPQGRVFYRAMPSSRVSYIGSSRKKAESLLLSMKMQIGSLRSLQDDPRVRAACLKYLQTWLIHFYPNRPDIVEEAQRLAVELGGELKPPPLRWKYAWMRRLFGYDVAKRAQLLLPQVKSSLARGWDKTLFHLEGSKLGL
jgi:glycosyltransferase involved in cell wall biosynthesis